MTAALEGVSGQQHASAALYPRERPGTHFTGCWVGPRAGLDGRKISPHRDSIPDRPARSSVAIPTELPGLSYIWCITEFMPTWWLRSSAMFCSGSPKSRVVFLLRHFKFIVLWDVRPWFGMCVVSEEPARSIIYADKISQPISNIITLPRFIQKKFLCYLSYVGEIQWVSCIGECMCYNSE